MSMLLRDNGLLFHHIPRTGGTTVRRVFISEVIYGMRRQLRGIV